MFFNIFKEIISNAYSHISLKRDFKVQKELPIVNFLMIEDHIQSVKPFWIFSNKFAALTKNTIGGNIKKNVLCENFGFSLRFRY